MEYWSVEKKHRYISRYSSTPLLQHSNVIKLIGFDSFSHRASLAGLWIGWVFSLQHTQSPDHGYAIESTAGLRQIKNATGRLSTL